MNVTGIGRQASTFIMVGVLSNLVGYLLYLLITWLGAAPYAAALALYCVGAGVGFFMNRRWTFRSADVWQESGIRYVILQIVGCGVNQLILGFGIHLLRLPHQFVQACAVVVVALLLFFGMRAFVFLRMNSGSQQEPIASQGGRHS